ncbi:MAG: xylulokinase [Planctomycetes bacterium]|nr:xylulokinase [Planctomycetota bacterium]
MEPCSLYLGFDVGTQGTKALAIDTARGEVVARAAVAYGLLPGLPPGHNEQDPETWIDAVAATARELLRHVDPARVAGLGVSGQQHGCVVLGAAGEVVRPAKLWCDVATAAEAEELSARLGRSVPAGFTASKLLWLRRHEPVNWARVRQVLLPHDFVNLRLCGLPSMEFGDASGTGFFDPVERAFDEEAMRAIAPGLPRLLPKLRPPGELAGRLSAGGAVLLGLPRGLPVAPGGGDNMMAAIGSGATRPGVVVVSLGTSGTIFTRTAAPVIDPAGSIAPFCSSDGGWLPLLCVMNLTGVTEEVVALTGLGHAELTALAARVPAGNDGLLWLPFLGGERVPDLPLATGTLLGLRPGLLRPGHLYRAALEGTACNLGSGLDRLRALGVAVAEVRLVGGAAKNPLWRQILANVFDVPVRPLVESEAAALGAALQALWSVRRAVGEAGLTTDDVVGPFVHLGEAVLPEPALAAAHRALAEHFRSEVQRLHPGAR